METDKERKRTIKKRLTLLGPSLLSCLFIISVCACGTASKEVINTSESQVNVQDKPKAPETSIEYSKIEKTEWLRPTLDDRIQFFNAVVDIDTKWRYFENDGIVGLYPFATDKQGWIQLAVLKGVKETPLKEVYSAFCEGRLSSSVDAANDMELHGSSSWADDNNVYYEEKDYLIRNDDDIYYVAFIEANELSDELKEFAKDFRENHFKFTNTSEFYAEELEKAKNQAIALSYSDYTSTGQIDERPKSIYFSCEGLIIDVKRLPGGLLKSYKFAENTPEGIVINDMESNPLMAGGSYIYNGSPVVLYGRIDAQGEISYIFGFVSSEKNNLLDVFKDSCKKYTFKEIARNPEKVKGELFGTKCCVFQVVEDNNSVAILARMDDWANEIIYIEYEKSSANEDRILDGDIINVYGILGGTKTYTSLTGEKTVPKVEGCIIDIIE